MSFPLLAQERHGPYKTNKFVEVDTFWVKMENGKAEKIRQIGMDTSEVTWLKKNETRKFDLRQGRPGIRQYKNTIPCTECKLYAEKVSIIRYLEFEKTMSGSRMSRYLHAGNQDSWKAMTL